MPTVGEQLRRAREARKLNLAQIAEQTKISRFYLEALEADQPERLPGPFFYKAFVKQYCRVLGVDAKQFAQEFTERVGDETLSIEELRQAKFPARERDPIMRAVNPQHSDLRFLFAAGGLIAMLLGGSFIYTWMQRPAGASATVIAQQQQQEQPQETASTPGVTLPVGVAPVTEQQPLQQQQQAEAPPQQVAQAGTEPQIQLQNTGNGTVVNLTPNIQDSEKAVSLAISAQEPTWLMILSDGKTLYQGILEPAQARVLAGRANAVIKVGNAAGVQVKWNGKQIGPIGERGQVRMIRFTGTEWEFVRPPQPKADPNLPKPNDI
ncbi:MAG: helix-turn-helix domain-containing protein [Acidobacteria bacterium]|nr:helix-turn-helix domain-containing protein [Acidobacteriota bacterium]